ncbi:Dimethylaniline monooxygenase N-oxide-forming [Penicillium lagena]|uniref:Dimethylaniline monooxygenase N-oxide-forming n=1 Tax=Penicillium lagena TaxID=94218 RepID=UPI0025402E6F|nr:Dimethylaniline monooxygenase N-oxide-forming [Penicillium lagena]KAJ5626213.1 Dimethylaniline monooxygenase N-oxide-forming [Penicillium lagena]
MSDSTIQRVAVIGAGISGVVSAGHLLAAGINVTVFERSRAAGGRVPIEVQYPCVKPSDVERYSRDERDERERKHLIHAPPGPCYESLRNNVSTPLLRTTLNAWPEGTPRYVNHHVLKDYIQDTSRVAGVDAATIYGALVTRVFKNGQKWHVVWSSLHEDSHTKGVVEQQHTEIFDAVVVASGHYHTPMIPDIPGLTEAKAKWPSKITHSKSFRNAEGVEGKKNVLLIGGGVSSVDIAREISPVVRTVYQSTRNGLFDVPASALPKNATRIEQVASFEMDSTDTAETHLPLTVRLKSGQTLNNIDRIVLCTGYQMVLPFLPEFTDHGEPVASPDSVIVTDGTQFHNLHHDIFYIPDPTLAFVGVSFYTATFTLFEFQAIAIAALFSGVAQLPSVESMRTEYKTRVETKGHGRSFHSLRGEEVDYVKQIIDWVNTARFAHGLPSIEGHTASWLEEKKVHVERLMSIWQGAIPYGNTVEAASGVEVSA